jgi:hypothetical protein
VVAFLFSTLSGIMPLRAPPGKEGRPMGQFLVDTLASIVGGLVSSLIVYLLLKKR